MQIDLDRHPVAARARDGRWLWLALAAVVAVLISATLAQRQSYAARPASISRQITFQVQGAGRADFAGVWTRTQVIRYVPSASSARYVDPLAAVLTIRADPDGQVTCRIWVDGVMVHEQFALSGQSSTCVWVAGAGTAVSNS